MRKQLEIILTALLPVVVLAVGFFAVSSKAELNKRETANPVAAGAYYRIPGVGGKYFGPEIYSSDLCSPADPDDFDIYVTSENASAFASHIPNAVYWHRFQRWNFTSEETPWGTNSAEITYNGNIGWKGDDLGVGNGRPWSGYEYHSRSIIDGEEVIYSGSDVTGWRKYTDENGKNHICPKFHKSGQSYKYYCETGKKDDPLVRVKEGDFGPFKFVDAEQQVVRRWADKTQRWYYCIKLVEPEEE